MVLPMGSEVRAFAPATVANLGPGFDVLGLALAEPGDVVVARRIATPEMRLEVHGDRGALPRAPGGNTAGIAAAEVLAKAEVEIGIELEIHKGMPPGSGLGSSAASAVAAALAVNGLLGSPLRRSELFGPCLAAETAVSGRHPENVAAALLGGLVLVRDMDPPDVVRLPVIDGLMVVVVTPALTLTTAAARAALPPDAPLASVVRNSANLAGIVSAFYSGDLGLLSRSLRDEIVTPTRARLIPGCQQVMRAATEAGALGSCISGSGPSVFALCRSKRTADEAARAMQEAFQEASVSPVSVVISPGDCPGARRL